MGSGEMKTVPVGVVSDLIKADVYFWARSWLLVILGSVPVAVAYAFLVEQRRLRPHRRRDEGLGR